MSRAIFVLADYTGRPASGLQDCERSQHNSVESIAAGLPDGLALANREQQWDGCQGD